MAEAKQIFEAAVWFRNGLPAGNDYSRETAEADCEAAMGRASAKHRVEIGPLRWSVLKVGDAGVPTTPTNAPSGVKLLHVEGTVIGPWKGPTKVKGVKRIKRPDTVAASSGRFGADLIRNACSNGELGAIAELAASVENALSWRNRQTKEAGAAPVVRGGAIANSEASNYAYRLVKSCHLHGHTPPAELVTLMQTVLDQDRPPRGTGPRQRKDSDWLVEAKRYWRTNPSARPADVARAAGVDRSTVAKAIKKGRLTPPVAE